MDRKASFHSRDGRIFTPNNPFVRAVPLDPRLVEGTVRGFLSGETIDQRSANVPRQIAKDIHDSNRPLRRAIEYVALNTGSPESHAVYRMAQDRLASVPEDHSFLEQPNFQADLAALNFILALGVQIVLRYALEDVQIQDNSPEVVLIDSLGKKLGVHMDNISSLPREKLGLLVRSFDIYSINQDEQEEADKLTGMIFASPGQTVSFSGRVTGVYKSQGGDVEGLEKTAQSLSDKAYHALDRYFSELRLIDYVESWNTTLDRLTGNLSWAELIELSTIFPDIKSTFLRKNIGAFLASGIMNPDLEISETDLMVAGMIPGEAIVSLLNVNLNPKRTNPEREGFDALNAANREFVTKLAPNSPIYAIAILREIVANFPPDRVRAFLGDIHELAQSTKETRELWFRTLVTLRHMDPDRTMDLIGYMESIPGINSRLGLVATDQREGVVALLPTGQLKVISDTRLASPADYVLWESRYQEKPKDAGSITQTPDVVDQNAELVDIETEELVAVTTEPDSDKPLPLFEMVSLNRLPAIARATDGLRAVEALGLGSRPFRRTEALWNSYRGNPNPMEPLVVLSDLFPVGRFVEAHRHGIEAVVLDPGNAHNVAFVLSREVSRRLSQGVADRMGLFASLTKQGFELDLDNLPENAGLRSFLEGLALVVADKTFYALDKSPYDQMLAKAAQSRIVTTNLPPGFPKPVMSDRGESPFYPVLLEDPGVTVLVGSR